MISLIAALNAERVIGIKNALPWHLPADLRHFKQLTLGKPVLMGRKTFESIGKPLPGRLNIIVTGDPRYVAAGCSVVRSIDEALSLVREHPEVMVIGGASFYAQMLPFARRMYLTIVDAPNITGDAFFPEWDAREWREVAREEHTPDANNPFVYRFVTLERTR